MSAAAIVRPSITPEQLAAWDAYQRARSDLGLLTDVEYAAIVGGRSNDDWEQFDARR